MAREYWGTFSVRDHTVKQAFAAEVLMYDRLIIPRPADHSQRVRWSAAKWAPGKLDSLLEVLRADHPAGHAITVPWNRQTEDLFRTRAKTADIVDSEANYGLTRRLLATELLPRGPGGVSPVAVIAAYPSPTVARRDWILRDPHQPRETLTVALAHRFLVPAAKRRSDLELLKDSVQLAGSSEFRQKRAQLRRWQDDVIQHGLSTAAALDEMAQYVREYNTAIKKAERTVYTKFTFTLFAIAVSAAGGFLGIPAGIGHVANLVRFWIFDRRPLVQAGEAQAAAMFHTVWNELGWGGAIEDNRV